MSYTRELAEYPEAHIQHIIELVKGRFLHCGFAYTPPDIYLRIMIRAGMTMDSIYATCCDVMAGFDLYESIEANRETEPE